MMKKCAFVIPKNSHDENMRLRNVMMKMRPFVIVGAKNFCTNRTFRCDESHKNFFSLPILYHDHRGKSNPKCDGHHIDLYKRFDYLIKMCAVTVRPDFC